MTYSGEEPELTIMAATPTNCRHINHIAFVVISDAARSIPARSSSPTPKYHEDEQIDDEAQLHKRTRQTPTRYTLGTGVISRRQRT
ncbi:hypothetical protein M5K25_007044 [Dendrobium thyrsiflorum]|uniref:Uncharacterized protein n=1 Tax=Dendrobium thyrsiflorum TaxID=117978 RepID=A0ABD0VE81_DENTH